ncbi:MAG: zinc metallopeptidase [Puniceicoccales bacterium]|jgi:Zn-dependent membrane protease YugP|nr:zinc metallopeptidase [Puniceicoccales bacterium]
MSFWDGYLDVQTTIRQSDARKAFALFQSCVKSASGAGERRVTDPNLCKEISCNPLLAEACRRKGLTWNWPSFSIVLWNFFRGFGRVLMAVLLLPFSIFVSFYARYRLNQMIANMRPLRGSNDQAAPAQKTAADFALNPEIEKEISARSGSKSLTSYGEDQSLSSSYYNPIPHRVTLPECLAKSSAPEALAVAAHECGHAEQRKFLLTKLVCSIAAIGAILVSCVLLFFFPAVAVVLLSVAVTALMAMPLITVFYEVDASKRGLANLIAYEAVASEEDSARAAYALQLAASTYLAGFLLTLVQGLVVLGNARPRPQPEPLSP